MSLRSTLNELSVVGDFNWLTLLLTVMFVVFFLSTDLSDFFHSSGRSSAVNTTTTGLTVGEMGLVERRQSGGEDKDLKKPDLLDFEKEIQVFRVIYFRNLVMYCKR